MACFADVLYQILISKKVDYIFSKSKLYSKLYFHLWDNKKSRQENCGDIL